MSPYEILGISPGAMPDEIKRAYRILSKQHHPDVGGDQTKMAEISKAYDVLIDPEKRARFDKTGQVDDPAANIEQEAIGQFLKMAEELFLKQLNAPSAENIDSFKRQIEDQRHDERTNLDRERERIESAIARIQTRPTMDYLGHFLNSKLQELEVKDQRHEHATKVFTRVFELWDQYLFDDSMCVVDPWPTGPGIFTFMNAGSSTSAG